MELPQTWDTLPVDVLSRIFIARGEADKRRVSELLEVSRRWAHLGSLSRLHQRGALVSPLVPIKPIAPGVSQMSLKAAKQLYGSAWKHLTPIERRVVLSSAAPEGVDIGKWEYRLEQTRHVTVQIETDEIDTRMPAIKEAFVPHQVKYGPQSVDWKNSCYMEISENTTPAREVSPQMLEVCFPFLQRCDEEMEKWYAGIYGSGSIEKLTRLQSFVTRYLPFDGQRALLKHVDGVQVDCSAILALNSNSEFEGGGVTVWDGVPRKQFDYPMLPGDLCLLDNMVWHQGNPIDAGERWVIVIFYTVRLDHPSLVGRTAELRSEMANDVGANECDQSAAA